MGVIEVRVVRKCYENSVIVKDNSKKVTYLNYQINKHVLQSEKLLIIKNKNENKCRYFQQQKKIMKVTIE